MNCNGLLDQALSVLPSGVVVSLTTASSRAVPNATCFSLLLKEITAATSAAFLVVCPVDPGLMSTATHRGRDEILGLFLVEPEHFRDLLEQIKVILCWHVLLLSYPEDYGRPGSRFLREWPAIYDQIFDAMRPVVAQLNRVIRAVP
jgi:hypothetical protein